MRKEGTMVYVNSVDDNGEHNYLDLTEVDLIILNMHIVNDNEFYEFKLIYEEDKDKLYLAIFDKKNDELNRIEMDPEQFTIAFEASVLNNNALDSQDYYAEKKKSLLNSIKR